MAKRMPGRQKLSCSKDMSHMDELSLFLPFLALNPVFLGHIFSWDGRSLGSRGEVSQVGKGAGER